MLIVGQLTHLSFVRKEHVLVGRQAHGLGVNYEYLRNLMTPQTNGYALTIDMQTGFVS